VVVNDITSTPSTSLDRYYVPQLDGLRFFAFLLVFMHHAPQSSQAFANHPLMRTGLSWLSNWGWMGVDLFLTLSAFLITSLLLIEWDREGHISLKDFYVRRTLRIWPLYYFALILGFVALPWFGLFQSPVGTPAHVQLVDNHLLPYLTFLGNYSAAVTGYAGSPFLAHLWTVALEEQFYILWPLLFGVAYRGGPRRVFQVLTGLLLLGVLLRLYVSGTNLRHPLSWVSLPTHMDSLIIGAGLALYRFYAPAEGRWAPGKIAAGIGLLLLASAAPKIQTQSIHITWQFLAVGGGFGLILDGVLTGTSRPLRRICTNRPVVWMGKLCYGLYIYHMFALRLSTDFTQEWLHMSVKGSAGWLVATGLSFLITLVLAYVSYRLLEVPFLKLKRRFTHIRSRPV